jgi:gliding motility-associated-like protein
VDYSGNQSPESEMVCNDNCPVFILPNVFTPNNDGHNDVFSDFQNAEKNSFEANCPQFIREVHFSVVNRWGKLIYKYNAKHLDVLRLNWNGNDNEGHKVRPGVYYYTAKVIFDVLDPDEQVHTYNGWIQVLY